MGPSLVTEILSRGGTSIVPLLTAGSSTRFSCARTLSDREPSRDLSSTVQQHGSARKLQLFDPAISKHHR